MRFGQAQDGLAFIPSPDVQALGSMAIDPGVQQSESSQFASITPEIAWPKTGETLPPQRLGPFDGGALATYALASGDDNPLHLDPVAAQSIGLPLPPVQGLLILASFEPSLAAWRPDLRLARLNAKFLRPVFVGQELILSGKVVRHRALPEAEIVLRLMAHLASAAGPGDLAILAEANLIRKSSPHVS